MTTSTIVSFIFTMMFVFSLIATVVGLILWLSQKKGSNGSLILTGLLVAILSFFALTITSTAVYFTNSRTCVFCHEMNPEYQTWKKSRHNRTQCLGCHLPVGGTITFIEHDLRALSEVFLHLTGDYPRILNKDSHVAKEIDDDACERCHDMSIERQIKVETEIKIDHEEHQEHGVTCTTCHNRVAHLGANDFPYLNGLKMMEGCMRCHAPGAERTIDGEKPPSDCSVCHLDRDRAERVFGKDDVDVSDFKMCRDCHELTDSDLVEEYDDSEMAEEEVDCDDCHGRHLKKFIAMPAAKVCSKCHEDAADEVISGEMGFEGFKPPFKKAKDVECDLCHKSHSFKEKRPSD